MRLSKIAWRNTSHSWPLETLNNIPGNRLRFFMTIFYERTQTGYCADAVFKEKVVRIFCVVCPCLFTLLLNCSANYLGKDQERQMRRHCMENCFHSDVEKFRRTLGAKIRNRNRWTNVTCLQLQIWSVDAVQDGCSLTITRINALKYNDIDNQIQPPYYSNGF